MLREEQQEKDLALCNELKDSSCEQCGAVGRRDVLRVKEPFVCSALGQKSHPHDVRSVLLGCPDL